LRTLLLLLAVLALLCVSVSAFNPYDADDDTDDVVSGETPQTATVQCVKDPATGEEKCESTVAASAVLDDAELTRKIEEAEAARAAEQAAKEEKQRKRHEDYQREREAKREQKRKRQEQEKKDNEKHGPKTDDYQIKAPLKKLRMDYYRYFGVERDASKLAIRKKANEKAVANHPDNCGTTKCKEEMIIINQARDVLLNDETREQYDFLLRWGFKVYDKDLYDDMLQQYKEDPGNMPDGFDDDFYDPSLDPYESMLLTEESAGWLLLLTGAVTLGLMALPVMKAWENRGSAEARKAQAKKDMLAAQSKGKEAMSSLKKKAEKFTGDRTVKRFTEGASPSPQASPKSASGSGPARPASASPKAATTATGTVAILCCIALLALVTPVAAVEEQSYYSLLDVAVGVEGAALKKA